jgi:hypothetical protein
LHSHHIESYENITRCEIRRGVERFCRGIHVRLHRGST